MAETRTASTTVLPCSSSGSFWGPCTVQPVSPHSTPWESHKPSVFPHPSPWEKSEIARVQRQIFSRSSDSLLIWAKGDRSKCKAECLPVCFITVILALFIGATCRCSGVLTWPKSWCYCCFDTLRTLSIPCSRCPCRKSVQKIWPTYPRLSARWYKGGIIA